MPSDLEFQVGLLDGAAVGYCPQTGHLSHVSLAGTARRLRREGKLHVPPDQVGALYEALGAMDDRPEVGAGKVAKKLGNVVKKVVKVAKKVANSKLGKVIMTAAKVVAGPFGGAALGAIGDGIKIAKSAASKKKPKSPAAAKKQTQAKKAAPIAAQLAKRQITPKQATAKAKKAGVPPKHVKSGAVALRVSFAAKAGNPKAKALMKTAQMMDAAKSKPAPLSVAPVEDEGPNPFATEPEAFEPEPFDELEQPEPVELPEPDELDDEQPELDELDGGGGFDFEADADLDVDWGGESDEAYA